jgi:hypothetical protein
MREQIEILGMSVWWAIIGIIVVAVIALGGLVIYSQLGPRRVQIEREIVENSKSYNDSGNIAIANYIATYLSLDSKVSETDNKEQQTVYRAQQKAIMQQICMQINTMSAKAPSNVQFINQYGGCQ